MLLGHRGTVVFSRAETKPSHHVIIVGVEEGNAYKVGSLSQTQADDGREHYTAANFSSLEEMASFLASSR